MTMLAALILLLATSTLPTPLVAAVPPATAAARPLSRAAREAAFVRSVDPAKSANFVTSDLRYYTGTHVNYTCEIETIVRPGVVLGQCGSEAEPIDLFVRLSTAGRHVGDRLRVLGIMEAPASWADVTGHTVYYAFLQAVFVDPVR